MKKFLCLSLLVVLILAFPGCEEGLKSDDTGTEEDGKFSFSDMYVKIKTLQEEVVRLNRVNEEQERTIEALSGSSSSSIGGLAARISELETDVAVLDETVVVNGSSISSLRDDVSGNGSSISSLQGDVSGNGSSISSLQGDVSGNGSSISSLQGDVSGNGSSISSLESTVDDNGTSLSSLQGDVDGNTDSIDNLDGDLSGFNSTFDGVTRLTDPETGQPTIRFSGVNVQLVSGSGSTNGTVNGLGNLIVGYNRVRTVPGDTDRSGSHNIIVGQCHNYSSYGGLVTGYWNTISGRYSSVGGGLGNTASVDFFNVSGISFIDDLPYSVSDGWSGTTLSTASSSWITGYEYISGAPEIILTDVKEGDVFLASLDVTASCGYFTFLATSGSIEWLGYGPTFFVPNSNTFSHKSRIGIFKATSNGTIIIRMHMKGYASGDFMSSN